jgi:hypothetical protein
VGRTVELADSTAAAGSPYIVAFVPGSGGMGKSRLLRRALGQMGAGVRAISLEGRET